MIWIHLVQLFGSGFLMALMSSMGRWRLSFSVDEPTKGGATTSATGEGDGMADGIWRHSCPCCLSFVGESLKTWAGGGATSSIKFLGRRFHQMFQL